MSAKQAIKIKNEGLFTILALVTLVVEWRPGLSVLLALASQYCETFECFFIH